MTATRKVTGIAMILAGFTFFAWAIALNIISPVVPENLKGTADLFLILSALTGISFLVSGGMNLFGHDQYVPKQIEEKPIYKPLPPAEPAPSTPSLIIEEEDPNKILPEKKKKEEEDETWAAPSKTGWG